MILVCGEALIDLFVGEPDGTALAARALAGGSLFNVAVGLARLGLPVGFLGGVSTDRFGMFLAQAMAREGIGTTLLKRSARPTPLAVVSTDAAGQPAYGFHAHDCAERDLVGADLPPPDPAVAAIALGSYTLAIEPVGSTLLAFAERESSRLVVSLDPNLRPSLVGDPDAWRQRFARFARAAAIIKLSREDLATAYGPDTDPAVWATRRLDEGALLVVITDGAAGATAYHRHHRLHRPAHPVAVVDTVGAGDTFHAALLARLAQRGLLTRAALAALDGAALADLVQYAIAAASITCTRRGADLPRHADVEHALKGVSDVPRA
ncbi:MAG: PfkB domain protein [Rhodospirillales bacterium]|nr:PfkB domain protein [Rhodospirillales bacterium]